MVQLNVCRGLSFVDGLGYALAAALLGFKKKKILSAPVLSILGPNSLEETRTGKIKKSLTRMPNG